MIKERGDDRRLGSDGANTRWVLVVVDEVKRLIGLAGPMVAVNLSQYFLQIISIMIVGHLGKLYLSATAIAISFCAVTGFSLLVRFLFFL